MMLTRTAISTCSASRLTATRTAPPPVRVLGGMFHTAATSCTTSGTTNAVAVVHTPSNNNSSSNNNSMSPFLRGGSDPRCRTMMCTLGCGTTTTTTTTATTTRSFSTATTTTTTGKPVSTKSSPFSSSSSSAMEQQDDGQGIPSDLVSETNPFTMNMAHAIMDRAYEQLYQDGTKWNRELRVLSAVQDETNMDLLQKWSTMMELFCGLKSSTISELGYYENTEDGLAQYTHDLEDLIQNEEKQDESKELLEELERKQIQIWNFLVSTCFRFDPTTDIPTISLEQARNISYKVHSSTIEDFVLDAIRDEAEEHTFAYPQDPQRMIREKHLIAQSIVLERVYGMYEHRQGKRPSIIEQYGFAPPLKDGDAETPDDQDVDLEKGYAIMQCALYPYRNDPFIQQITVKAMTMVWQAALDFGK